MGQLAGNMVCTIMPPPRPVFKRLTHYMKKDSRSTPLNNAKETNMDTKYRNCTQDKTDTIN
jgi:hypothetical protein